ncbi:MAG: peptide ABC transporter substrate-binding protein [Oligoflexia bacterium]
MLLRWVGFFLGLACWMAPGVASAQGVRQVLKNSQKPSQAFRFRLAGDPETLDWNRAHTAEDAFLMLNLMEGLMELDDRLKPQPRLAERYSVSRDGKTLTFTLRAGVQWQDGVLLRAQDFEYSWKRLLSPVTAASYAYLLFDVQGAREFHAGTLKDFSKVGIRALDERRLEVQLKSPSAQWIFATTFWPLFPVRKDAVERHGDAWATPGKMLTLGPYVLASRELGSKIVLEANPKYWGSRGNIARVEAVVTPDAKLASALFDSGMLDVMKDPPSVELKRLDKSRELYFFSSLATHYLGFAIPRHPASQPALRRAIAHAIDRKELMRVLGEKGTPAGGFIPPGLAGYRASGGLEFDPIRARSLLRMSGVLSSNLTSRWAIDLLIQASDRNRVMAESIQSQLKKNLGIDVTIQEFENKAFREQLDLKAYPMFLLQWAADYPEAENFLSVFLPDSGNNRTGWSQAGYLKLMEGARTASQSKERVKQYEAADRMLVDQEAVLVPLFYGSTAARVSQRSRGVKFNPMGFLYLRDVSVD